MMMREERAKQFQPFDAMKGLQEALRDREERHSRVERHEVFAKLTKGMHVQLDCYSKFHDVTKKGTITEISTVFRYLKLGKEKIFFCDIYDITITDWSEGND